MLISHLYWRFFKTPEACHTSRCGDSEKLFACNTQLEFETYLITVGDDIQLTNGVLIHTHGWRILLQKKSGFEVFGGGYYQGLV